MKNDIDKGINNNYLNDYIDYHFKKEKNKFSKLKYYLLNNNPKKNSEINSYNIIEPNYNENLPYINKQSILNGLLSNDTIKSIKNDNIQNRRNYYRKSKFLPTKLFDNIFNNIPIHNKNIDLNNAVNLDFDSNSNLILNSHRGDESPTKRSNYNEIKKRTLKKLKIELDKELIENDKYNKSRKNINDLQNKKKLKKIRSEIRAKKEKEEEKIIDILYIGNNIFNNCKIKNKTIYDIRPLNKTKQKASCRFDSENNSKSNINDNEIKIITKSESNKKIPDIKINNNTNYLTQKSLKYFRNSYSEIYSTNTNFQNNNITIQVNDDNGDRTNNNKKLENYELSEKELINKLKINKDENYKKNINIELNKVIRQLNKNKRKKEIYENIFYNSNKKENINKNFLDFIDLSLLAKEIVDNEKYKKNLHSFFSKEEENVMRGEKIKFLKTCYQIKLVKPLLSQHTYEFKKTPSTKKIFSPKKKQFPVNHFYLDILKKKEFKRN